MKRKGIIGLMCLVVFGLMFSFGALAAVKEITIWSWGASEDIVLGLQENSWPLIEKEFGVKIKHELFPGLSEAEGVTKFVTALRFGGGPDIIETNDIMFSTLAYAGLLQTVPSWLDDSLQEKLIPAYKDIHYLWDKDGHKKPFVGALTRKAGGMVLWWNKEMYKEAGLDKSPETWDEVFDFCKKLTKYSADGLIERSGISMRTGGHISGIGDKWTSIFLSAGGESLLKVENGEVKVNFNTSAAVQATQFYLDVLYKYNLDAMGIPGDMGGWMKGLTATISARRFFLPLRLKQQAPDMYPKLGAGSIPVREKGMVARTIDHAHGLAVNPSISSEKKELIWKILDRLNQVDMIRLRTVDIESWLPYKEVQNEAPFTEEVWREALKAAENSVHRVEAPKITLVDELLGEQLELIFLKEKSIEEGLAIATESVNEAFEGVMLY